MRHPLGLLGSPWTSAVAPAAVLTPSTEPVIELGWHDQPDYYTTALMPRFWDTVHADAIVVAGDGYGGGSAWSGSSEAAYAVTFLPIQDSERFGLGCRLKIQALPAAEKILLGVVEEDGVVQCCVSLGTDGTLALWRGALVAQIGERSSPVSLFSELKVGLRGTVDRTQGILEAQLNGSPVLRASDVNTAESDHVAWHGIYLGLAPNIFHSHGYAGWGPGELRPGYLVKVLRPTTIHTNEWDANTGTIDEAIDDVTADDDTTYAYSTELEQRFATFVGTMPETRAIYGTRLVALVRNIPGNGGSPSYAPMIRSAEGVHHLAPWKSVVQDAWRAIDRFDRRDPFLATPWTADRINTYGYGGVTRP